MMGLMLPTIFFFNNYAFREPFSEPFWATWVKGQAYMNVLCVINPFLSVFSPSQSPDCHIWDQTRLWCVCLVAQSHLALCDPMDCGPPGFSVRGIFQARILGWVVISYSRQDCEFNCKLLATVGSKCEFLFYVSQTKPQLIKYILAF